AMKPPEIHVVARVLASFARFWRFTKLANLVYIKNALGRDLAQGSIQTKAPVGGFIRHVLKGTTTALGLDPELYDLYIASGAYGGNAEAVLRSMLRAQTSTGLVHTTAPGWRRT